MAGNAGALTLARHSAFQLRGVNLSTMDLNASYTRSISKDSESSGVAKEGMEYYQCAERLVALKVFTRGLAPGHRNGLVVVANADVVALELGPFRIAQVAGGLATDAGGWLSGARAAQK